ncbi:hypothetical protein CI102_1804 [Trichoderma harzianum]|uniref:Uncharacterized protein n=1 Tax=Trichoderma harzianum CBS 226.95 TaxID=983964 RepID=A0A2T4AV90_TRIHA|nr:hypothetical protein M431DRAFT_941 [Trichoderma harzianum CBS 226.95]PKK52832.1 hypothetical protein CI102_1804 [Trichoderma harzianum]PTB60983.1 hypothetical protein M431DRAFT_941 [Trichoderma harzianum CBS 226.95]
MTHLWALIRVTAYIFYMIYNNKVFAAVALILAATVYAAPSNIKELQDRAKWRFNPNIFLFPDGACTQKPIYSKPTTGQDPLVCVNFDQKLYGAHVLTDSYHGCTIYFFEGRNCQGSSVTWTNKCSLTGNTQESLTKKSSVPKGDLWSDTCYPIANNNQGAFVLTEGVHSFFLALD